MALDDYEEALDETASAISDLTQFDQLCAASCNALDEQRALAAIASSEPGLELVRLWNGAAGEDADRMRAAFERELTERGLWTTTRRAFALVREHVTRSRRPVPESNSEQDAATIVELIALAQGGSPNGDTVATLGAEALMLAATLDGRDRALELVDDIHLQVGDDALGVIRASVFESQVREAIGEPAVARKLCREILQYGRRVEGAGRSIEAAARLLGRQEQQLGHAFRAAQNLDLAARLAKARAAR